VIVAAWGVSLLVVLVAALPVLLTFLRRRHGESDRPEAGWQRTEEVFRDPGTGRIVRVWTDRSGARHYVPER
jgi:hypothetical protein